MLPASLNYHLGGLKLSLFTSASSCINWHIVYIRPLVLRPLIFVYHHSFTEITIDCLLGLRMEASQK